MENASTSPTTPPGWHPDPHIPGHMRWWSGINWTEHTQPAPPVQPAFPVAGQPVQPQPVAQQTAATTTYQPADPRDARTAPSDPSAMQLAAHSDSIVQKNPCSFYAMGISATYLVLALYTGIVLFGVLPAYFGFKAFQKGEKLAPLGIIAAGIAIAFAITSAKQS